MPTLYQIVIVATLIAMIINIIAMMMGDRGDNHHKLQKIKDELELHNAHVANLIKERSRLERRLLQGEKNPDVKSIVFDDVEEDVELIQLKEGIPEMEKARGWRREDLL